MVWPTVRSIVGLNVLHDWLTNECLGSNFCVKQQVLFLLLFNWPPVEQ